MPRARLAGPDVLEDRTVPAADFRDLPVVPVIDGEMQQNLEQVVALGASLGNRPNVFSKVGDSITALPFSGSFGPLGAADYNPVASGLSALDPSLEATREEYLAPVDGLGENSFDRVSSSAYSGWTSIQAAAQVPGELAAVRPWAELVMIGTNDAISMNVPQYTANLERIVRETLAAGVVPVLSTVPYNDTGTGGLRLWTTTVNQVVADVADEFDVPVWNFWKALLGLPRDGLADGVHPDASPLGAADFNAASLQFGYNVRNLTGLQVLRHLGQELQGTAPPDGFVVPPTTPWTPLRPGERVLATGANVGNAPTVRLTDADTGRVLTQFQAYDSGFLGGVRVAVADLTGDGVPDLITAPGPGGGPNVKVFSGTDGHLVASFFAFEPTFTGGVTVAAGDLGGNGGADIVVGAGPGGGPRVRMFAGTGLAPVADFFAFEPTFTGGVNVAVGDFGPGVGPGIAIGPGVGGGGLVKVFGVGGDLRAAVSLFDPAYRGGVFVAAGDLGGSGSADLVAGAASGSTRVVAVTPGGDIHASFYAGGSDRKGARVGVLPAVGTAPAVILTGTADPAGAVSLFDPSGGRVGRGAGSADAFLLNGPYVGG